MDDKVKYYLVMRNDVIELGFKNMDKFGADLFCLVMREIRRNVEKLNRNYCTFEYRDLKEILNIDDHLSYAQHGKHIRRTQAKVAVENTEYLLEVINSKLSTGTTQDKQTVPETVKATVTLPASMSEYETRKVYIDLYLN